MAIWRIEPLPIPEFFGSDTPEAEAALEAISQGLSGTPGNGSPGASAYQIWLQQGNTGTEADFLASLVGETGATGATGPQGLKGDKGDKGDPGVTPPIAISDVSGLALKLQVLTDRLNQIAPPAIASFLGFDAVTKGSWVGVYGSGGNVVFGASPSQLPSGVSVSITGPHDTYVWAANTSDDRALQQANGRIASLWYSYSTFDINIQNSADLTLRLALYCLDWDAGNRNQIIRVFDAANNQIDERSVSAFGAGIWLKYEITKSVRIAISKVSGSTAAISGVFFDVL